VPGPSFSKVGVGLKGATDVECTFIHLGVTKEVVGVEIVIQLKIQEAKY